MPCGPYARAVPGPNKHPATTLLAKMAPRSSSNNKKGRHCPLFLAVVLLLSSSVAHGYRVRPPVTMTASKTKKPQAQTLASSQAAPVGMPPPLLDTKMVPGSR